MFGLFQRGLQLGVQRGLQLQFQLRQFLFREVLRKLRSRAVDAGLVASEGALAR